jgi:hypothetical protein
LILKVIQAILRVELTDSGFLQKDALGSLIFLGVTMIGINKIINLVCSPIWDYRQKLAMRNVSY